MAFSTTQSSIASVQGYVVVVMRMRRRRHARRDDDARHHSRAHATTGRRRRHRDDDDDSSSRSRAYLCARSYLRARVSRLRDACVRRACVTREGDARVDGGSSSRAYQPCRAVDASERW